MADSFMRIFLFLKNEWTAPSQGQLFRTCGLELRALYFRAPTRFREIAEQG
jgi:hypothetical protein